MVFNVDQATVSRDMSYLEPVARECTIPEKMHAAANKVQSIVELEVTVLGLAALVGVSGRHTGKTTRHRKSTRARPNDTQDPVRNDL